MTLFFGNCQVAVMRGEWGHADQSFRRSDGKPATNQDELVNVPRATRQEGLKSLREPVPGPARGRLPGSNSNIRYRSEKGKWQAVFAGGLKAKFA